jgi:hypothetical protein
MVNLGALPEPILTPFPRKKRPAPKPVAQAQEVEVVPEPATKKQERQVRQPNAPPVEPIILVQNGTEIPLPFRPVSFLDAMRCQNPAMALAMVKQLRENNPMPNTGAGALAVMDKLEEVLMRGEDVSILGDQIAVFLTGQTERRELFDGLENSLDEQRRVEMLKTRAVTEDFLHGAQRSGTNDVIQAIATQGYFNAELDKIYIKRSKRAASGEMVTSKDTHELVQAVNLPTQAQRKQLLQKFDEASPSEREIIRKLGFKIQQGLTAARITTTTTETVELVQQPPQGCQNRSVK